MMMKKKKETKVAACICNFICTHISSSLQQKWLGQQRLPPNNDDDLFCSDIQNFVADGFWFSLTRLI